MWLFFEEIRVLANAKTHAENGLPHPALEKNCFFRNTVAGGSKPFIEKVGWAFLR